MPNDGTDGAAPKMTELEQAIQDAESEGEVERYEPRFELLEAMSCRSISEMNDAQLEEYIGKYEELVYQAEQNLESKRAKLGASKLERAERSVARRGKKRAPKMDLGQAVDQLAAQSRPPVKPVASSVQAWLQDHKTSETKR